MAQFSSADPRTAARGEWLFEQIVATGSLVVRDLGGGRDGEMAAHRYLSSPYVCWAIFVEALSDRTRLAATGRRVVVAQDTTEINFSGRGKARRGLGPAGDGKSPGFFIHPNVVIDADEEAMLGLVGCQIWTRADGKVGPGYKRAAEDKESIRWSQGSLNAATLVGHARQVIDVTDREGDVWRHIAHRPEGVDLATRARHNRALEGGTCLFTALVDQPPLAITRVEVAPQKIGEKVRVAEVVIRAGKVRIKRPPAAPRSDPKVLEMGLVEAIEQDAPEGVEPLCWRILTTLPVATAEDAQEVVRLYRLRWRIEEVFRALKGDGLALEDTQMQDAERLFRLSALALGAAVRIIQLVDARDGGPRPMSDVLDQNLVEDVAILVKAREGATAKQKNPHPQGSLAWLSWVVARYGGWNCYGKPPGPKTMAKGWQRFSATLAGVLIARHGELPVNPIARKGRRRRAPVALALVCLGATLAGCIDLAPTYHRPAQPTPATFPGAAASPSDDRPLVGWRDFFADARLKAVIEQALANNRDLRVAVANIAAARAQYHVPAGGAISDDHRRAQRHLRPGTGRSGRRRRLSRRGPAPIASTSTVSPPASAPTSSTCSARCATSPARPRTSISPPRRRATRPRSL